MKKMRKMLAVMLAFVMIVGMSLTANAETDSTSPYAASITVTGLADGDSTTVSLYCAISLNDEENEWVVADWAVPYISEDEENGEYTITDKPGLLAAVSGDAVASKTVTGKVAEFDALPIGAYVVVAAGAKADYSCMVAETYKYEETYMAAEDVTVVAKASNYNVTKTVSDQFVKVGQELDFTVTTVFPNFEEITENSTYVLKDTPTNLILNAESVNVKLGGADLVKGTDYTVEMITEEEVEKLKIDLSNSIAANNGNAGKVVTVTYTGVVTGTTDDEEAFLNTVVAIRNDEELGGDSTEGYTGDITITKTDDSENPVVLNGAEFKVYKNYDSKEGAVNTALKFTRLADVTEEGKTIAVYELDVNGTVTDIEAENGHVRVIGLDEGDYWFEETKAPAGYSINEAGVSVTITAPEDHADTEEVNEAYVHVHMNASLKDTKLINLPSTGGVGTTIFTIIGCGIMIAAVFFFFVSRRRENR